MGGERQSEGVDEGEGEGENNKAISRQWTVEWVSHLPVVSEQMRLRAGR